MKFKEFVKWCNERAADGCWGMQTAMICANIMSEIRAIRWWKRNKFWKQNYEQDVVNDIIIPIDEKRKTWLGR